MATSADDVIVRDIRRKAFSPLRTIYRPSEQAYANRKDIAPDLQSLIATFDDEVVGTVGYYVAGKQLHLMGLAVLPRWQRRGVARALIDRLKEIGRSDKCSYISLFTVAETGNVPVFERLGFRIVSTGPDVHSVSPIGQPLTETRMELRIERIGIEYPTWSPSHDNRK